MVTGVTTNSNMMQTNVIGAPSAMQQQHKEAIPVKSDRRSNKPIMEKRRRARINNCLNELKAFLLDATKKDPARHSKLEKADILEKTVKHLQELQRQQAIMQQATDPKVLNKFKAGFADCANEVSRFPGLDPATKRRLLQHLSSCLNGVKTELHQHQRQSAAATQQLHAQILPSPPSSPEQQDNHHPHHVHHQQQMQQMQQSLPTATTTTTSPYTIQHTASGYFLPNGLQVIPTKLPNGSIALVLPQSLPLQQQLPKDHQQQQQQQNLNKLPQHPAMLVSIPMRTASTSSASSHASSSCGYECNLTASSTGGNNLLAVPVPSSYTPPSPANSYEAMEYKPTVIQHASSTGYFPAAGNIADHQQQQQQQQQLHPQPLSLVVRKDIIKKEEQPWRPW